MFNDSGPRSDYVQSGGLSSKLVPLELDDDYEDDDQINEFNDNNHNESLYYKRLKEKQNITNASKLNLLEVTPKAKTALKNRSGSSRSIRGGTTPIGNEKKLLDLSNTSIAESIRSRNVSFRLGNNGKLRRKVGSPVSVNSRLCGEDTFHNFQSLYELYERYNFLNGFDIHDVLYIVKKTVYL